MYTAIIGGGVEAEALWLTGEEVQPPSSTMYESLREVRFVCVRACEGVGEENIKVDDFVGMLPICICAVNIYSTQYTQSIFIYDISLDTGVTMHESLGQRGPKM